MDVSNIAIVIPCYNRTNALLRLLASIVNANLPSCSIDIVFSIDYSGKNDVSNIAEAFKWNYGVKKIIHHPQNIGLRNNIIFCGDLTSEYVAIIVLEDDLVVSKDFLNYSLQAYEYYQDYANIGGISLYKYEYCEFGQFLVYPLELGFDTYFVQWPSSRGQLWSRSQWKSFKDWYCINNGDLSAFNIPDEAKAWPKSWKKYYAAYLVDTNKYFAYPSVSFTNVFGTIGEHYSNNLNIDTVSLFYGEKMKYNFQKWNRSVLYDCFFEMKGVQVILENKFVDVDMDLYVTKRKTNLITDYVVSPIKLSNVNALKSWGGDNIPFELNILNDYPGDFFYLYRKQDYNPKRLSPCKKKYLRIALYGRDILHDLINSVIFYVGNKTFSMKK